MKRSKDSDYRRLITSRKWQKLRWLQLIRQPYCERCARHGLHVEATEVHHVHPVQDALSRDDKVRLMFDPSNIMSVCHKCHVELHEEMGRSGKAWSKRHASALLEAFKRRFMGGGD